MDEKNKKTSKDWMKQHSVGGLKEHAQKSKAIGNQEEILNQYNCNTWHVKSIVENAIVQLAPGASFLRKTFS